MAFDITIIAGKDAASSTIRVTGEINELLAPEERVSFGLTDALLNKAIERNAGKVPDKVYLRDHPAYEEQGWNPVRRTVLALQARIISIELEPVALVTNYYENMRGKRATTHTATLAYASEVSFATNWSTGIKLSVEQKFTYKIGLPSNEVGGETSIGFESTLGVSTTATRSSTITTTNAVELTLDPGTSASATLSARKGTLRAQVVYYAQLEGDVYYDYTTPHKGHHRWRVDVGDVLDGEGLPSDSLFSQEIEVGFYADAKVVVTDDQEQEEMQVVPAQLTLD